MSSIINFFREAKSELSKVAWPTRDQVINNTLLVVLVTFLVAAFLGGLDYSFSSIVKTLILK